MPRPLKTVRLEKGWSQEKLAGELNIHRITLLKYEKEGAKPPRATIFLAAHLLGVDPNDINEYHVKPKTTKSL